jgi:soluble lytic murein transglycosylase-like protein
MLSDSCAAAAPASRSARRAALACALACVLACSLPGRPALGAQEPPTPELRERVKAALATAHSFQDRFDAQVWLTDMAGRLGRQVPDPETRIEILRTVHREATRNALPPEMVLAVIDIESAFNPYAVSSAGAQGLMQVMPFWREELGRRRLIDIGDNILMGCTILRYYYDMEDGDWTKALARYNGSVGRTVYSQKVLDRLRTRWFQQ